MCDENRRKKKQFISKLKSCRASSIYTLHSNKIRKKKFQNIFASAELYVYSIGLSLFRKNIFIFEKIEKLVESICFYFLFPLMRQQTRHFGLHARL